MKLNVIHNKFIKYIPLLILVLLAVITHYNIDAKRLLKRDNDGRSHSSSNQENARQDGKISIKNYITSPELHTFINNRKIYVKAANAYKSISNISLHNVSGNIGISDNIDILFKSYNGLIYKAEKALTLSEEVEFVLDDKKLSTQNIKIFYKSGEEKIEASNPVEIKGIFGTMNADRMSIDADKANFSGNVVLFLKEGTSNVQ